MPIILVLNIFLPVAIIVMLVVGGFYLAYEGIEKFVEFIFHKKQPEEKIVVEVANQSDALEKVKRSRMKESN